MLVGGELARPLTSGDTRRRFEATRRPRRRCGRAPLKARRELEDRNRVGKIPHEWTAAGRMHLVARPNELRQHRAEYVDVEPIGVRSPFRRPGCLIWPTVL